MKDVSVILITWNSERYVQPCLDAVLQAVKGFMYEILIIDNGSTDATLSLLEAYEDEWVHLYRYEENHGVACARNVGLQRATGNFIWILDIDTLPTSAAWHGMFDFMHAHSDCGICACQLFHASGEVQDSCRRYPSLRYKILNVLSAICPSPQLARLNESQFYHVAMQGEEPFEVEWLFSPKVAEEAKNFVFHPNQTLTENSDGSLTVKFCAGGRREMDWFLYTWGDDVKVIKPESEN